VTLACGDLLAPLGNRRFDLIVSNPPYVAEQDPHLSRGDLRFEPQVALSCAEHGLAVIQRLVAQARDHLHSGGYLVLEHGHDQATGVSAFFDRQGFSDVRTHDDLNGIGRVTLGRWRGD
jgi:release factor glutamine methyltransferase